MKIAMFSETFLPMTDGIVTRLRATIDVLLEEGHQVLMFAPEGGITAYRACKVVGLKGLPLIVYPEKQMTFPSFRIYSELKAFQPDVIHAVNPMNIGAFGIYYANKMHLPLVSSYHTNVAAYMRYYHLSLLESTAWSYIRKLHNQSQINLATSSSTVQELRKQGIRRMYLWDRGVDRSQFGPQYATTAMRQRLSGNNPEKTIFLYVGRLGHEKGLERLKPALEAHPDVGIAFVGDGPAKEELEKRFGDTSAVFTGFLHGRELAQAYASADAFVFPSTTETLGLVLMEAMASGLPIVAADTGPTREILSDGETALLFDPDHQDSLVQTILRLTENPPWRQELGKAAYRAAENLDWRKPTRQLLSYYDKAIQMKKRQQGVLHIHRTESGTSLQKTGSEQGKEYTH